LFFAKAFSMELLGGVWESMASRAKQKPRPAPAPPRIYEAKLAPGPSGVVFKSAEIDQATAIAERRAGRDIVVCGENVDENRRLARMSSQPSVLANAMIRISEQGRMPCRTTSKLSRHRVGTL